MADELLSDEELERDRRAEEWLCARHKRDWYIGEGTAAEWRAAYAAVDEIARAALDGLAETPEGQ